MLTENNNTYGWNTEWRVQPGRRHNCALPSSINSVNAQPTCYLLRSARAPLTAATAAAVGDVGVGVGVGYKDEDASDYVECYIGQEYFNIYIYYYTEAANT